MRRLGWVGFIVGLASAVGAWGLVSRPFDPSSASRLWSWPLHQGTPPDRWDLRFPEVLVPPTRSPSGPESIRPLMEAVERIRHLRFRQPLTTRPLTDRALRDLLESERREEAQRYEASEKVLRLLGLLSPRQRLWPLLASLYEEQVVGVYDPRTRVLFWRQGTMGATERSVIVHELSHAVVDQNFDLRAYLYDPAVRRDGEARMARQAVAEGDATLVMVQYQIETLGGEGTALADLLEATSEALDGILEALTDFPQGMGPYPPWLVRLFAAPYIDGMRLVLAAFQQRGWEGINDLYRRPPATTSQLLHPERYFQGRPGRVVEAPAVSEGRVLDRDRVGELSWYVWLEHFTDRATAERAADGWDGDMAVLTQTDGKWRWQAVTRWQSEADAAEFEAAVRQAMEKRARDPEALPVHWKVRREGLFVDFWVATGAVSQTVDR